jgi:hypothetical protein
MKKSAIWLLLIALASFASEAMGEDYFTPRQSAQPIIGTTYQDFDALQKISLGATVLINPTVAAKSMVLYSADIDALLTKDNAESLAQRVRTGEITVAKELSPGQYETLSPKDGSEFVKAGNKSGRFLSALKLEAESQKVISWSQ